MRFVPPEAATNFTIPDPPPRSNNVHLPVAREQSRNLPVKWPSIPLLAVVVSVAGCGDDDIKVYRVAKEPPAATMPNELPAGHPDISGTTPAAPRLTWTVPAGWEEQPPGDVRLASFRVVGGPGRRADVSVVALPGDAGGDLANVNRWRGQVQLDPLPADELSKHAESVDAAGQPAALYDQGGETDRILAVIQRRNGTSWFYKMTGDAKFVAEQKPVFVEFLKTLSFGAAPTGNPKWRVPADWTEAPAGQFLFAKFTVAGGKAAVNVSTAPGDGGGVEANVGRWRNQLGLAGSAGTVMTRDGITYVEMAGESASLVAAIVAQPGQTWFYKLMGDADAVAAQKDAFLTFVQGAAY